MKKMLRVTLPGVVLILAMALGAWSAPQVRAGSNGTATPKPSQSAGNSSSNQSGSNQSGQNGSSSALSSVNPAALIGKMDTSASAMTLKGSLAQTSGLQERVTAINSFSFNMTSFNSSFSSFSSSEFDKQFVEESLTSNSAELLAMERAIYKVSDSDLRNLIYFMIQMHKKDQQTLLQIAPKFGIDVSSVDFTNASVYPETPDYDLGMRTENITEKYLSKVVEKTSGTNYDDVVLHVLDSMHAEDVQSELTAERVVQSQDLKAFAKHSADVTELHLELIDMVSERVSLHLNKVDSPDFSAGYMSPMQITVNGQSSQGQSGNSSSNSGSNQSGSSSNQSGSGSSSSSSSGGSH